VPVPRRIAGEPIAIHLIRDISTRHRSERLARAAIETVAQFMSETSENESQAAPHPPPESSLSAREVELLRLLADGLGTRAISLQMGISESTVRNHIQRLLAKLGVHRRLEAVVYGARHGLI
jgi:DNA-binding NarL/FixJ family response regulator